MNILVCRTDKLGDFITALPAIYVLKKHNPKNKIIVCVAPINKEFAYSCEFIDEVIVDNAQSIFSLASSFRDAKVDVSVSLFSNTRIAFAQFLAGIKKRIAPATKIAQIFYTHRVTQRRSEVKMAEFEYNLELTKEVFSDIDLSYKQPLLSFDDSKDIYLDFCKKYSISKNVIAFHVGFGGSSDANLNLDEYEILIRDILKADIYQVVLTFGPDEVELASEMKERLKDEKVVFYISNDGLVYFAKLVSGFSLFVSTSTGTYHIASLVGTKTITFFADTLFASAKRWKSVGDINLQTHFMLSSEDEKREKMFDNIKEKLV